MPSSAPSALARSSFSADPAVTMMRAPWARATWIAACPTPLPAARMSTVSPGRNCARVTSMCHADRKVRGNAAASTKPIPSGIGTTFSTGTVTSSA